jgi:hypothetical protein
METALLALHAFVAVLVSPLTRPYPFGVEVVISIAVVAPPTFCICVAMGRLLVYGGDDLGREQDAKPRSKPNMPLASSNVESPSDVAEDIEMAAAPPSRAVAAGPTVTVAATALAIGVGVNSGERLEESEVVMYDSSCSPNLPLDS